ncbi:uncharacterized protein LOC112528465 [Cynara cardunculus var. scolymus]|uniref:uncharacterized protein LOC112528465 n=1 Tax=Cynara cardunculus var. scolymus TaxID=59895 RepID=UPI000D62DE87|nr:uncharacterized protein LOC112528465 [Cynara cardunculus var. scolymus]
MPTKRNGQDYILLECVTINGITTILKLQPHLNRSTPWAEEKVIKRINKSATWTTHTNISIVFEVRDGHKNGVVDLLQQTCSCRQWRLYGLPCGHVIAVCRRTGLTKTNFWATKYYTTQIYRATYLEVLNPVNPCAAWEYLTEHMTLKPPLVDKK